jgi:hypothetical protein
MSAHWPVKWEEPTEVILQKQQETVGILAACGGEDVNFFRSSANRFCLPCISMYWFRLRFCTSSHIPMLRKWLAQWLLHLPDWIEVRRTAAPADAALEAFCVTIIGQRCRRIEKCSAVSNAV